VFSAAEPPPWRELQTLARATEMTFRPTNWPNHALVQHRTRDYESESERIKEEEMEEVERLKKESKAMVALLKQLEKEENELKIQNEILAREALLNGYSPDLLESSITKRRKPYTKKNEGGGNTTN
jgi:L-fucose isomerase-like protein